MKWKKMESRRKWKLRGRGEEVEEANRDEKRGGR